MTVWPVMTLGEVCEVARGTSITRKDTKEGMIPVVAGGIDVAYFHSVQNRPAGTITVSSSGANAGFVNRWDVPIFASDCSTVVAKEGGMVFSDYAFRFLQFKQNFINAELRRGAAQPHVYAKDIAAIEIPVPPMEEQKRIVELLDAATARIAELTACYEQARTHANNLFTSALSSALEGNPVWPVMTLGEVCEVARGTSITRKDTKEGMIPVVAGGIDVAYFHSVQNRPAGTITVSSSGANAGFVNRWDVPIFASDCSTVVAKEGGMVFSDYAFRFLQFKQNFINAELRRGAAQPHVYAKDIAAIEIPVPPMEEQKRIVARLDSMKAKTTEMVAAYDAKLAAAKNLRQSILEAAFGGDL